TFEQSDPLTFLISQHQIFSISRRGFSKVYVRQGFSKVLQKVHLETDCAMDLGDLEGFVMEAALNKIVDNLQVVGKLLLHPQVSELDNHHHTVRLSSKLESLADPQKREWQRRYAQEARAADQRHEISPPMDRVRLLFKGVISKENREIVREASA